MKIFHSHRLALFLLAAALMLGLTACGQTAEAPKTEPAAEASAEPTAKPTAEPTAEPTVEPTAEPTPEPTPEPTVEPKAKAEETLSLGGDVSVSPDAQELTLKAEDFTLDALLEALPALKSLRSLTLEGAPLSAEEFASLKGALAEDVSLRCGVKLGSLSVDADAEKLDLSKLKRSELKDALAACALLGEVKSVELMDKKGVSPFKTEDVLKLKEALPEAAIHYEFELLGERVSTLDESVVFNAVALTEEDEPALREALSILGCSRFVLDKTRDGMSDETIAQLREDFPARGVVWRCYFPGYSVQTSAEVSALTDEEIIRITFILNDVNVVPLKYFNNAIYVDVGHDPELSDISFASYMPHLQCLIISGSSVKDISPLKDCQELLWAEFCFCGHLEDISPLAGLESLRYVNVSETAVKDISPLMELPLERLVTFRCAIPKEQQDQFVEAHPDCLAGFVGEQPYGYPWRYNAGGAIASNFFEYYARMRELFIYDDRSYVNNTRDNRYGPGYIALRPFNLVYEEDGRITKDTPYQAFVREGILWPAPDQAAP